MRHPDASPTTRLEAWARSVLTASAILGVCAWAGCSGGDGSGPGSSGGSSAPATTGGGSTGGLGGTPGTGGTRADSGGAGPTGGGGSGGTSASSTYANLGVCGSRIQATADAASFNGYEEHYILGNGGVDGAGSEVCIVRFDLKRVGDAPAPCTECAWAHLLEYSNPSVVKDADGVCAKSDLGLDSAAIAKITGTRFALGFAMNYGGAHASARLTYNDASRTWEVTGNANWSQTSKTFKSDFRDGFCNYGP